LDPPLDPDFSGLYKKDVEVVWFESWRYQNEISPIIPLIQEIRNQLTKTAQVKAEAGKLLDVSVRSALRAFEFSLGGVKMDFKSIEKTGREYEDEKHLTKPTVDSIREELEYAVERVLKYTKEGSSNRKLVIMIDDLDRCEPSCVYRLLEGIKVYLSLKNTVFVLACDIRQIESAVASSRAFPLLSGSEERIR